MDEKPETLTPRLRFSEFLGGPGWQPRPLSSVLDYERPERYLVSDTGYRPSGTPVLTANKSFVLGYTGETDGVFANVPVIIFDDFTTDRKYVDFPFKVKSSAIKILTPKTDDDLRLIFELMGLLRFDPKEHKRYYISEYQHLEILLPCRGEQQKVAACLTSLDRGITVEGRKLQALRKHREGLMQELFPREGETRPRFRFPEFREAPEWNRKRMDEISTIVRGGSPRPIEAFLTKDPTGLNWLKIGDVDEGAKYVTRTEQRVSSEALSKTRLINPGDFILSNSMSFGRPYISKISTCIHDGWIAVTGINSRIKSEFLYYSLMTTRSQSYFANQAAGGGVRNLTTEIVKAMPILSCASLEQEQIASCLSSLDVVVAAQKRKLDCLREHKRGLMQQLFPAPEWK